MSAASVADFREAAFGVPDTFLDIRRGPIQDVGQVSTDRSHSAASCWSLARGLRR